MPDGDRSEGHTVKALDQALAELRLTALAMGGLVIDQVNCAVRGLVEGDLEAALRVDQRERQVNDLDRRIDRDAFELIALRQPMAGDLRMAKAIARVGIELERIGDEAKKIARFAARLCAGEPHEPVEIVAPQLRSMTQLAGAMLRDAVRSMDEDDAALARDVTVRDEALDSEFEAALQRLLATTVDGEAELKATTDTVLALRGLERIGDHATNVAEQVLFMLAA